MADVTVESSLAADAENTSRRWSVATDADTFYDFFLISGAEPFFHYKKSTDGVASWGTGVAVRGTQSNLGFGIWYDKWTPGITTTKIRICYAVDDAIRYKSLQTSTDTLSSEVTLDTVLQFTNWALVEDGHLEICLAKNGDLHAFYQQDHDTQNGHFKSTAASDGASWTSRAAIHQGDYNDLFMLLPANTADDADICVLWWDESASEVKVFIHDDSADSNSAAVSVGTSLNFDLTSPQYWQWSAQVRHSDGHIILAVRNEIGSTGDIRVFDITPSATPSVTELTTVLSNTAGAGVDVFIDQNTDDIYIAWLQGTLAATTDVYYAISTDNGSTWGTAVGPVNETAADDYRNLCSNGMVLSGDAGRYALSWVNDDTDDLMTNKVNSVSISTGGGASVTPTTASLTTTKYAPTVTASDHKSVTPSTLALVTALFAATVTATANQLVTPSTLAQVLSLFAATVSATANQTATPDTLALTTTGNAPTVSASGNQSVTPSLLELALSLLTPTVTAGGNQSVTPSTLALVLSLFAATVQTPVSVTPDTLALALNPTAPTVQTPVTVTPTTGALVTATFAPVATATANQLVTVTTLALTLALFAPTVTGDAVSVIGRMLLHDEATARAILNDARVNTALLRDELVWLAEARD